MIEEPVILPTVEVASFSSRLVPYMPKISKIEAKKSAIKAISFFVLAGIEVFFAFSSGAVDLVFFSGSFFNILLC